jgi:hypothetical protein
VATATPRTPENHVAMAFSISVGYRFFPSPE